MLLLLKNEKFTQPVWIPSWCSFASLRFLYPCYWNFQRSTDTARDGLDAGRTLLVPDVSELQQRIGWVAHTVVCALSFSSLVTPKMQTVKGIAGIITLLCLFTCVLVLFFLLWDSALSCTLCMVFPKWGCLKIESLLMYHRHSLSVLECTPCARNGLWLGTSLMH